MKRINTKNIVFITGAFVNNSCWDEWKTYFMNKGFNVIAPPWPYKEGTSQELRDRQPFDVDLADLTLDQVTDHFAKIVKSFPEKPIAIGHSTGGLVTQILVNKNLVGAGVAIHSLPPQGIIPYEFSFLRSTWKSLGIFTPVTQTYLMSFEDWQYAFVNGMSEEEQKESYDKFIIPESKKLARSALTSAAKVDFNKAHPPLLFTSGSEDHIIPAHLNKRNFDKYQKRSDSLTEYMEFPGRNHFVLGQDSWKEDADYILEWIGRN